MKQSYKLVAIVLLLCIAMPGKAQIPAFPGAEGYGAYATGGRGGDVYTVTSLNNSGSGTLREALDTAPAGGRTIVFAVSGYIPVVSDTNFQVPANVTIAGQTAPGDGVGLKGGRMLINGDNVIMRHFRIRHGKYGTGGDCLNIAATAHTTMLDHISMMFSTDENFSFFSNAIDDYTMQFCTSSWGMERHNAGGLWDLEDGTCHHTLWAHHTTRNPKARPYGLLEWINNVTFDYGTGFIMGDSESNVDWYANVIGCYYLAIPSYRFGTPSKGLSKARIASDGQPNFHLFLTNCLYDSNNDGVLNGTDEGYGIVDGLPYPQAGTTPGTVSYDQLSSPRPGAPVAVTIDDPLTAYKKVISSAGALRLDASATTLRDELDTLLINSVINQESIMVAKDSPTVTNAPPSNGEQHLADTYGISNNGFGTLNSTAYPVDSDGDGMPDFWENSIGSDPSVANNNDPAPASGSYIPLPSGYTMLEEYLHFKAIPHAVIMENTVASPSSLTVDLRRYTCGFTNSPSFSLFAVNNGSYQQFSADGSTPSSTGPIVVFTPTQDFYGRASYLFRVTDSDGSSWVQKLGVMVVDIETDPPTPNPATFATPPTAISSTRITMTATSGSDESGPVEYYFTCIAGDGNDSGWQTSPTYVDKGLSPAVQYSYTVKMRDSALTPNVGSASDPYSTTTFTGPGSFLESGGVLSMEAENGIMGSRWVTGADAGASSGEYIEVDPVYGHTGGAPEGETEEYLVSYDFDVSTSGDYRFWFRMYSSGGTNDSFFWRIDDGDWNVENNRSGIGDWFSTDNAQVDSLDTGGHALEISYREKGTRLDKFVIQLDGLSDPNGEGPVESDRTATPLSLAYSYSNGMFTITWDTPGWILQRNTDLLSTNWVDIPTTVSNTSRSVPVDILPWAESFYRLVKP